MENDSMPKLEKTDQDAPLMVENDNTIEEEEEEDDFLLDVVCFTCTYLDKCGSGQEYNPITCPWLRDWLEVSLVRWQEEYEYVDEDEEEE